jgi:hypothetical protein
MDLVSAVKPGDLALSHPTGLSSFLLPGQRNSGENSASYLVSALAGISFLVRATHVPFSCQPKNDPSF